MAVGQFYRDFRQLDDAEVVALLAPSDPGTPELNTILPPDWPATIEDARAMQQRLRGQVVIRLPDDQAGLMGFGHQWKSTLPW